MKINNQELKQIIAWLFATGDYRDTSNEYSKFIEGFGTIYITDKCITTYDFTISLEQATFGEVTFLKDTNKDSFVYIHNLAESYMKDFCLLSLSYITDLATLLSNHDAPKSMSFLHIYEEEDIYFGKLLYSLQGVMCLVHDDVTVYWNGKAAYYLGDSEKAVPLLDAVTTCLKLSDEIDRYNKAMFDGITNSDFRSLRGYFDEGSLNTFHMWVDTAVRAATKVGESVVYDEDANLFKLPTGALILTTNSGVYTAVSLTGNDESFMFMYQNDTGVGFVLAPADYVLPYIPFEPPAQNRESDKSQKTDVVDLAQAFYTALTVSGKPVYGRVSAEVCERIANMLCHYVDDIDDLVEYIRKNFT